MTTESSSANNVVMIIYGFLTRMTKAQVVGPRPPASECGCIALDD